MATGPRKGRTPTTTTTHRHVNDAMRKCADECRRCHDLCLETISTYLHAGGEHADPHYVRMLMDGV